MPNSLLSSPLEPRPASTGMVRKRTWHDLQPSTPAGPPHSHASSSSPYLTASDADASGFNSFLSSPPTIYSSPMGRSNSAQSSFSAFTQPPSSPKKGLTPPSGRPGMKRRRTIADVTESPTSPTKEPESPASLDAIALGQLKEGENVWPQDVEEAFQTALRLLPRLGRKKLIINGKACGRNELIGDYIKRHTGKERSRKQVSSHIQVLKNMRKDDVEFMNLVDPIEGDDRFEDGNARLFFGDNTLSSSSMSTFLEHSLSSRDKAFPPPIDLSNTFSLPPLPINSSPNHLGVSTLNSPLFLHSPAATTPTSILTNALRDMTVVPQAPSPHPVATACPFTPAEVCMRIAPAEGGKRRNGHVVSRLESQGGPATRVFLEDLPQGPKRFPQLADMVDHLPCQFLHVKLNLDVPSPSSAAGLGTTLESFIRLHAVQPLPLTAVTTIFCHGDEIINFEDPLSSPVPLDSSDGLHIDMSPTGQHLPRYTFAYDVNFAPEYWTFLLRTGAAPGQPSPGAKPPTFGRAGKDRQELAQNLSMFSVLQEFVVPRSDEASPSGHGQGISRGSAKGDVVLVVAYDLEIVEGPRKGTADLSILSVRRSRTKQYRQPSFTPYTAPRAPSMRRSATSPPNIAYSPPTNSSSMPPPPVPTSARQHGSPVKPNLQALHIPSPSQFIRRSSAGNLGQPAPSPGLRASGGPITPYGQLMHTPTAPPPLNAVPPSPVHRQRLEQHWAQNSQGWDLHSPALMGVSAPPHSYPAPQAFAAPAPFPSPIPLRTGAPPPPVYVEPAMVSSSFELNSAFEDAVAFTPLSPSSATASAFEQHHAHSHPNFPSPPINLPESSFILQDPLQHDEMLLPYESVPTARSSGLPDLVPMSACSSSTGSTTSGASLATPSTLSVSLPPPPPAVHVSSSTASKVRMEQDYFSSLLGTSTK
ncbi:hypothetical protein JCM10207_007346 [Rhodosporidiobolus poonsookiae]